MCAETPGASRPAVSCVIVAFHRPNLVECLVAALAHPDVEVVVVNVEDDAELRGLPGATIIPVHHNVGYAGGVNIGVARSSADVIAFMNDDVQATAADILNLTERVRSLAADVVVPVVLGADGVPEAPERPPYGLADRMQLKGQPLPSQPARIDAAWASIVVSRADLLRDVPLAEDYFLYWEEFDWFHRLRERMIRVELLPDVQVRHLGGPHVARRDKSQLMARNAVRCVRRNRGRAAALRVWPRVMAWQGRLLMTSMLTARGRQSSPAHMAGVRAALSAWREI